VRKHDVYPGDATRALSTWASLVFAVIFEQ
jgi:hypothetical protein